MKTIRITSIFLMMSFGWFSSAVAADARETYRGNCGKQVYILEDVHGDYEIQLSHFKTLSDLIAKNSLHLLATEGATGYLTSLPLQKNQPVASFASIGAVNALLERNQINAATLLNAVAGDSLTVVGVENKKEYEAHLAVAARIAQRANAVNAELDKLEAAAQRNQNQKLLGEIQNLRKIFSLKVSRAAADEWKEISPSVTLENLLASLPAGTILDGELLKTQMKDVENYYRMALQRDATLAANLLERMELEQEKSAALIVGGFHTAGITEILRKNGISTTVISPE